MRFKEFFTTNVKRATVLFILLNLFLYLFIINFSNKVPFHTFNYRYNANHYIEDSRVKGEGFKLTNALAQYDAQWYLKIAEVGYPTNPHSTALEVMDGATYAFFPLYPIALRNLDFVFNDILVTAFFLSNILLLLNFWGLIYILREFVKENIAIKTAFLLFLFPFSIFYRSYFTEGLFLFFLIWFSHFFVKKNYTYSSILLGFLNATRGSGVLLFIPYIYYLYKDLKKRKITIPKAAVSLFFSLIPSALWSLFSYAQTGDPLFFMKIRSSWTHVSNPIMQVFQNTDAILNFFNQALHSFHSSKIDILMILAALTILVLSYEKINIKLWLIAFCLFLTPLIFIDTMSYARYQTVSFPLFLYLATVIKTKHLIFLMIISGVGLLFVSLIFVNWYWVG